MFVKKHTTLTNWWDAFPILVCFMPSLHFFFFSHDILRQDSAL